MKAKRIFVCSMPRSGSMWTYNITRELIRAAGWEPIPGDVPVDETPFIHKAFNVPADENQVYCVKTHKPIHPELPETLIIYTYRDVRDALISFMRFIKTDFNNAIIAAQVWMKTTDLFYQNQTQDLLMVRYNEIISQPMGMIQKIDKLIGAGVSLEIMEEINQRFSREKVAQVISASLDPNNYGKAEVSDTIPPNKDGSVRLLDNATGFQTGHISSKGDGEWRAALTEEQQEILMQKSVVWLEKYGFNL